MFVLPTPCNTWSVLAMFLGSIHLLHFCPMFFLCWVWCGLRLCIPWGALAFCCNHAALTCRHMQSPWVQSLFAESYLRSFCLWQEAIPKVHWKCLTDTCQGCLKVLKLHFSCACLVVLFGTLCLVCPLPADSSLICCYLACASSSLCHSF